MNISRTLGTSSAMVITLLVILIVLTKNRLIFSDNFQFLCYAIPTANDYIQSFNEHSLMVVIPASSGT